MRVLALAPYPETAPSTRYRVEQLRPALAERGVEVELKPFLPDHEYRGVLSGGSIPARLGHLVGAFEGLRATVARADRYDAVWVQRGLAPFFDRRFLDDLVAGGTGLVYDFDDAVYLPQEGGRGWLERLRAPAATTRAFCRAARIVLAGNEHLAAFAGDAVGEAEPGRVRVVPSVVDVDRFRPAEGPSGAGSGAPTVGWVGSGTTLPYLEALAPALRELGRRAEFRLRVVAGPSPPDLGGVAFEFESWTPEREVRVFQELDVGLYPLEASPWTVGKCGFKAIQYLACGVPPVASPVGVLPQIVVDGETGLLASGTEAWVEALERLIRDPELRRRLGRSGRERVVARYSVDAVAGDVESALRDAAGGPT